MDITSIYLIMMFCASIVLIVLYVGTLLHNFNGSNFKLISVVLGMLLLSNVATIFITWADYELLQKDNSKPVYVWMLGIAYSMQDTPFSVVHLVMAFEYLKMARNIPKAIQRLS
jgi:predicted membrane chloride channel (bestrophin family)